MIHLIHGIHTAQGDKVVPALIPYLAGPISYPDYGRILGVETAHINPMIVGAIKPYILPGDILIGHSNGCAIIYRLLLEGAQVAGVVFIDAALKSGITLPDYVKFAHVYFNDGDDVTELAALAEALAGTPVDEYWGDMGHRGYTGNDTRFINFDCANTPNMPKVDGHSDIFMIGKIEAWGQYIAKGIIDEAGHV